MIQRYVPLLMSLVSVFSLQLPYAEEIIVGLEPMAPLIVDAQSGYTISMLKACEKVGDVQFIIKIMPYSRAKEELKKGTIMMMGHIPYGSETPEFYKEAQELNWSQPAKTDMYAIKSEFLDPAKAKTIGVPRGNKDFFVEVTGLPAQKFVDDGELESLMKMVTLGRIDAVLFERASTMSLVKKLQYSTIVYKCLLKGPPVGLAVRKDEKGTACKNKIENLLQKIDQKKIFAEYTAFTNLADEGSVLAK